MTRLGCLVLALTLASPANAQEPAPLHVKVSGFVRGSCRIEAGRSANVVRAACNVPWAVAGAEPAANPGRSDNGQGSAGSPPRVVLTPTL